MGRRSLFIWIGARLATFLTWCQRVNSSVDHLVRVVAVTAQLRRAYCVTNANSRGMCPVLILATDLVKNGCVHSAGHRVSHDVALAA